MLENAQAIKDSATLQLTEREAEEAHASIDYLEKELSEAYYNLRDRVGKARADEIAVDLVKLAF